MARPRDSLVEHGLRGAASDVAYEGNGTWRLSIVNGAAVPARARVLDGWFELRAALPAWALSRHDDLSWLRINARLDGSVRVAHLLGNRVPYLMADTRIAHEPDRDDRVMSACIDLSGALHAVENSHEDMAYFQAQAPRTAVAEIERACADFGWPCTVGTDGTVRLDIVTRAGALAARLESSPAGAARAVVELIDMADQPVVSRRAVAALLMALSGSVRSVKAVVRERDGATVAALVSPLEGPIDRSLDRALSALAVACHVSGREVQALRDERLAAEYLALRDAAPQHDSYTTEEEHTCLQQL